MHALPPSDTSATTAVSPALWAIPINTNAFSDRQSITFPLADLSLVLCSNIPMLYKITLAAAVAGLAFAQDDTPSSIDLNTIPTVTITGNIVTGSAASTPDVVTATGVACIPESDMVFSIQTDTSIRTGPLTVTPLCGQSVTPTGMETGSMTTQGVITGGVGGNATVINNSTVSLTTTVAGTETGLTTISATGSETTNSEAQSGTDSSAPAATQTDSPAGKVGVGAAAGLLGLAAGVVML
ncbi:hypothetical protein CERZMDRAFT_85996 [Cercospora zeae-maydis SCOH1-5]|uniref:Uncharacterized protein n=1 Tax=Cercospora zeae-maydis SCOH1-5 TaxID=717836 RepID=A0A6A6FB67_9PEZI|nr:hypothetical protein CERZMDRAFT_85996 [Cercospora zeae-maydis SCOH1-5]